jgi:hypothetical protein
VISEADVKIARCITASILVTFLALVAQAQTAPVIVIRAGHLFDSKSGKLLNNQVILVKEEKIIAVGAADACKFRPTLKLSI